MEDVCDIVYSGERIESGELREREEPIEAGGGST